MLLTPYLSFPGTCREAFTRYAAILGGTVEMMLDYDGSPMEPEVPAEMRGKLMHAELRIGDQVLMGADAPPAWRTTPQGFSVQLGVESAAEAERIFQALAEGGEVTMAMAETFWAERFGMCVDRFGTPWMINGPAKSF